MQSKPADEDLPRSRAFSWLDATAWWIVVAAVVVLPLIVVPAAEESFRSPKDVAFVALGVLLALLGAIASFAHIRNERGVRTVSLFVATTVAWSLISAAFSQNRSLSLRSLTWVGVAAILALTVDRLGRDRTAAALAWCLPAAVVNAFLFLLQRFHLWNPFQFKPDIPEHFRYTGLVGNPDDVGSYLVVPALVAAALFLNGKRFRALWGAVTILLLAALFTGQLSPAIACAAGLLCMGFMKSRRVGLATVAAVLISSILLIAAFAPLRNRLVRIGGNLKAKDYAEALSGRVIPVYAALLMASQNPITGVGPGVFAFDYFDYKLAVEKAHPEFTRAFASSYNFGETHNDYLQTLAETGFPGLLLLLCALFLLGRSSFARGPSHPADEVRMLGFPLAVSTAVLWAAQFPLHLSTPLLTTMFVASLCLALGSIPEVSAPSFILKAWPERRAFRTAASCALIASAVVVGGWAARTMCYWPAVSELNKPAIAQKTALADRLNDYRTAALARSNIEILSRCIAGDPTDPDLYMLAGANYRLLQRDEDAAATYERALQFNRRPEIYYELGVVELALNRRERALEHLTLAVRFSRDYLTDLPDDVRDQITADLRRNFPYLGT